MSAFLRRASAQLLRSGAQRGGHSWPGGSFWAEGTQTGRNGYLFGETPPPNGQARKWESWEFMTCAEPLWAPLLLLLRLPLPLQPLYACLAPRIPCVMFHMVTTARTL